MKTIKDLLLNELEDMYDAERRIVKALPKLAKATTSPELREAFLSHLKETEGQVEKLERVFALLDAKVKGQKCEATVGLIEEADEVASEFKGSPALNAALIAAAQKVEHYEMASYGCLHEWANLIGNQEAAELLQEILEEERAANEALNDLAKSSINQEGLEGAENGREEKPEPGSRRLRPGISNRKRTEPMAD